MECLLCTRLCKLRGIAAFSSQLLSWIQWLIHQPRRLRQLGDDSVYRGHAHSELRRTLYLEHPPLWHIFGAQGSEFLGLGRRRQLAKWWGGLGDNLYCNHLALLEGSFFFKPSFREFCLVHTAEENKKMSCFQLSIWFCLYLSKLA